MKLKVPYAVLLLLFMCCFAACDSERIIDQYRKIDESAWHKDSLAVFHVPVADTLQSYNLQIQIRHESTYEYSNLWLFIQITQPGGKMLRDTFEIVLAEPSGRWLGDGFGGVRTIQADFRKNFSFPASGDYSISLQHGMRNEVLRGIHDVGIRIEKAKFRG